MLDGAGDEALAGFGMFTILIPALISPVIGILAWNEHRARKAGALEHIVAPWKLGSAGKFARSLVVDMDLLGLLLLVASFTCILIPLTIVRALAPS
jgi:SIT family siderophore-iron:H+ symporter-like MFS transporter